MAFRTLVISSPSKIEYSLNYVVFRTVEDTKRIFIDEISTIIFEVPSIAITCAALIELLKHKVNVIFCDEKHNPKGQLISLNSSHNSFKKISLQMKWQEDAKNNVWNEIIKNKLKGEYYHLLKRNKIEEAKLILSYLNEVVNGDETNREGHAAKVYFNSIFFKGFSRSEDCDINFLLDYGYSMVLSLFNRSIVSYGYMTQIGIHHKNEENEFNLSCDFMEPFRVFVDQYAIMIEKEENLKEKIREFVNINIKIDGKIQTLNNAINIYTLSLFDALKNDDINLIKFPESYEL